MDESQNTHEEAQPSDKDSLPLGESVPPEQPNLPLQAATNPAVAQQHIAAQPSGKQPEEVIEEEFGKFDSLMLRWTRLNVIVLAATLVAIVGTGIVFWDPFQEMATQSNLLGISARQATRDSADASLTTTKQLKIAQQQAKAAQDSVAAIQAQMRQDQRPLLKVTAAFDHDPLIVGNTIGGTVTIQNIGKSTAASIDGRWYLRVMKNREKFKFSYPKKGNWWGVTTGDIYPNNETLTEKAYWIP